jgi:NAD(P)-dependent dehydrogenase (short-subunit alcohol dehydrogenase family)
MGTVVSGRLAGKVAIVTGGASGIGAGTVRRFVAEGASVVIADLQPAGQLLARELGDATSFRATDVAVEEDVAAVVDHAVERFGRLDVMFNNAGIIGAVGSIAKSRMDDVDRTFAVLLRGTYLGMKHAARVMKPQRSGVILSTTSPGGLHGGLGPHAYSAAKAGIVGLTQSVAAELRRHHVRVVAIAPGAVVSAMTADLVTGDPTDLAGAARELGRGLPGQ